MDIKGIRKYNKLGWASVLISFFRGEGWGRFHHEDYNNIKMDPQKRPHYIVENSSFGNHMRFIGSSWGEAKTLGKVNTK